LRKGTKATPELKAKLSLSHKGKVTSSETKAKLRETTRETWNNQETRKARTEGVRASKLQPGMKEKMSKVLTEALNRPDAKQHQCAAAKERNSRPDMKEHVRKAATERWKDADYKQKTSESIKRAKNLPEAKQKTSAAMKIITNLPEQRERARKQSLERWSHPEFRQMVIASMSGPNSPNWNGGTSFDPYCPKFNREFKERVRTFFDHKCVLCGIDETENGRRLSVHHVDYDKEVCCNDRRPAFAAVCGKHNTIANHDRDRWRSIFHRIIDEMYDGKCYFTKEEFCNLS
jgi:hypothetical protein